jgi:cytochrome c biogenesis protein CcdA/thiol-disulfide isomerase/thioredoxin
MILLLISFIAGALTALAPCTISLLPVIVGGSLSGERSLRRALVVTASLGVSVIVFTFILKVSTVFINVPQTFWQDLSGVVIVLLGLAMVYPSIWDKIPGLNKVNMGSNRLLATGYKKQSFLGDILVGAALGPVFSSCSPTYFLILATVLPASLIAGFGYLLAFASGLCLLLLIITLAGQKIVEKLGVASDPSSNFKRGIGVFFIIVGIAIFFGLDKKVQTSLASVPFLDETRIEQLLLAQNGPAGQGGGYADTGATNASGTTAASRDAMKSMRYQKAPEITDPSGFINTGGVPITIAQFKGKKVVLIDFWTYSCINCQRTLPYMRAWYDKYNSEGLEIISIHTPEFAFEHVLDNVQKATDGFGLKYPVVLDNDYGTWNAFGNQYWPRKYLIDIDGYVVYDHAGEGNYDVTEKAIQNALTERAQVLGLPSDTVSGSIVNPSNVVTVSSSVSSPETYFGAARNEYLGNGAQGKMNVQMLAVPDSTDSNTLYLGGVWRFDTEFAASQGPSTVVYRYRAQNVYFVASSDKGVNATVLLDGKPIGESAGADVAKDGTVAIKDNRLYHLVHTAGVEEHTLEIRTDSAGLDAYTFTFG